MEERGIITGATIQMNFSHFGFDALVTLLISVDAQDIEQAMEFIEKTTEVRAYRQYNNIYNIRAVATLRNLYELDHIKQIIKRKLPSIGLKTYVWTGVRNIPENLNLVADKDFKGANLLPNSSKPDLKPIERVIIDELDQQIAGKLTLDGRSSFTEIAKEIGVSTDTVVKRYHRLRQSGSIKVSVQINPKEVGYTQILDFNLSFTTFGGLSDTVVEALSEIPDIIIITKTSGDFDLQLTAMVRDVAQTFAIQDQIAKISGVTKIETTSRKIPDKWPTPLQYISTL